MHLCLDPPRPLPPCILTYGRGKTGRGKISPATGPCDRRYAEASGAPSVACTCSGHIIEATFSSTSCCLSFSSSLSCWAAVEGNGLRPPDRERVVSPTLQTHQDPILAGFPNPNQVVSVAWSSHLVIIVVYTRSTRTGHHARQLRRCAHVDLDVIDSRVMLRFLHVVSHLPHHLLPSHDGRPTPPAASPHPSPQRGYKLSAWRRASRVADGVAWCALYTLAHLMVVSRATGGHVEECSEAALRVLVCGTGCWSCSTQVLQVKRLANPCLPLPRVIAPPLCSCRCTASRA
jgi:hypothetical protein